MTNVNFFKAVAFLLLLLFNVACKQEKIKDSEQDTSTIPVDTIKPKYAHGFYFIKKSPDDYVLVLQDEDQKQTVKFYLSYNDAGKERLNIIHLPVNRAIAFSSTHFGFLEPLNQTHIIKGISGKDYLIAANKQTIEEIGFTQNINFEKIVALQPQVVFGNNIQSLTANYVDKFRQLGIIYLPVSEYTEKTPLARAEWIKVFGLLTAKSALADSLFQVIENEYLHWKKIAAEKLKNRERPTVLMSFPYQNTWYVPGGQSFQATFVKDAGGKYIFSENNNKNSFIADAEIILDKGKNAGFWLNLNHIQTKKEIIRENPVFARFKSYQNNRIYNNNRQMHGQANAYWQTGVINPHIILRDIIFILHNDTSQNLYYYRQIQ